MEEKGPMELNQPSINALYQIVWKTDTSPKRLWKSRNDFLFKEKDYDARGTMARAIEDAEEWLNRVEGEDKRHPSTIVSRRSNRWSPPQDGWFKCNVDAAWKKELNQYGIGWVLRDHQGRVLWMGVRAILKLKTVLDVEAEAIRWAVVCVSRFNY
ncbi:uncharacterized protein LOC112088198 [Eutrema salsugineum]|uniref:uncharacterized protein LOC112088198 n=1 Tax=Eutrema salsugineum TaxID=72664 RepID=UPI000CED4B1F|nr:uncharacterized protein LOC112088198 [Eutrema salsugineum]